MKIAISKKRSLILLLLVFLVGSMIAQPVNATADHWIVSGSLSYLRENHSLTLLNNDKVLLAGGSNKSAEVYDSQTGIWTLTPPMSVIRYAQSATLLSDGRVLVAGGTDGTTTHQSAEIYDPGSNTWTLTGSMNVGRHSHGAALLPDGKVLVAGGISSSSFLASAEVFDPSTGLWTLTGSLHSLRSSTQMIALPNGTVLYAGGENAPYSWLKTAEVYYPTAGIWLYTGSTSYFHDYHPPILLKNGEVLLAGGPETPNCELFDYRTGTWRSTGSLNLIRRNPAISLLPSGRVLAAGGSIFAGPGTTTSVEIFNPVTGTWSMGSSMNKAQYGRAVLLNNGNVLVAGTLFSELYDENDIPFAIAGNDQEVTRRTTVTLNGSSSYDPDGDNPISYIWTQTNGSPVTLNSPSSQTPTFVAPSVSGVLTFSLVVTDRLGLASVADEVVITVVNQAPVANAGEDRSVGRLAPVTLDSSLSNDPDGDTPLTYQWSQTGGTAVELDSSTVQTPTFTTPDDPMTLTFSLVVTDSLGLASVADEVVITVVNQAPVADAGEDQSINTLSLVTLDSRLSHDPDGDTPLLFSWSQTGGNPVIMDSLNTPNPTFIAPDDPETLSFSLTVTDSLGLSGAADEVVIEVLNQIPVADAGEDQKVLSYMETFLNGLRSHDPDGDTPLVCEWTQIGGLAVILSDPTSCTPKFMSPKDDTTLILSLIVRDSYGTVSLADNIEIVVERRKYFLPLTINN